MCFQIKHKHSRDNRIIGRSSIPKRIAIVSLSKRHPTRLEGWKKYPPVRSLNLLCKKSSDTADFYEKKIVTMYVAQCFGTQSFCRKHGVSTCAPRSCSVPQSRFFGSNFMEKIYKNGSPFGPFFRLKGGTKNVLSLLFPWYCTLLLLEPALIYTMNPSDTEYNKSYVLFKPLDALPTFTLWRASSVPMHSWYIQSL